MNFEQDIDELKYSFIKSNAIENKYFTGKIKSIFYCYL